MPLYHGDLEAAGLPTGALALRRLLAEHDALFVSTPEYNAFVPPLLVNAFDWVSRVPASDGLPQGLATTAGKVAGLVSASPGPLGGLLGALRGFLGATIGLLVVPEHYALGQADKALADGATLDARQDAGLQRVVDAVLRTGRALQAAARPIRRALSRPRSAARASR
ncbi:NAD(P)H-dependent oxidoreductase [Piscinibacter sakaiensis]|uniref:NADPH-dependent FMN reductase n=1 Tax=Piscinibacter sakaiensis TaxID=1547922 RepID=UPI00372C7A64